MSYYSGGSYNWSNWNGWGSYNTSNPTEDKDLIVKSPSNYNTPTARSFERKIWGGYMKENVDFIKNMSRFFFHQMTGVTKDEEIWEDDIDAESLEFYQEVVSQIEDLPITGKTPLSKAIDLFNLFETGSGKNPDPSKLTKDKMKEALNFINKHQEIVFDPVVKELMTRHDHTKQRKSEIIKRLSLVGGFGDKFKVELAHNEKEVAASIDIRQKRMRTYDQSHQIDLYQRVMPNFKHKFLTKDLRCNVPVETRAEKQKIIILVDYSGSMNRDDKQDWVCSIMLDRLRYAIKGDCEIFFSYFVSSVRDLKFTHIYDKESAYKFWTHFSTDPDGGDTKLGLMVDTINKSINEDKRLCNLNVDLSKEKVEILAIADGQDSAKTDNFSYKTNAVSLLDSENQELKKLCLDNKGKYIFINRKDKVIHYE